MKKETTATRLKTIMNERNLRQIDVLNLTLPYCKKYNVKMNKSDISQYCSGKNEPNQDKLFVLGAALNVSEAWLMGFDVPRERKTTTISSNTHTDYTIFTPEYKQILEEIESLDTHQKEFVARLLHYYNALSDIGRKKVLDNAEDMVKIYGNTEDSLQVNAAHERTDIEITEEMKKHDNSIMDDENF